MTDRSIVDRALDIAARSGLPGPAGREPMVLDPATTLEVLGQAGRLRVVGLVQDAVEQGALVLPDGTADEVAAANLAALRTTLVAEETAVLAVEALEAVGVHTRVLKGVAAAHLDYDHPALRQYGDADVLIHRADRSRAIAGLQRAGFTRAHPPVRGWWEQRYAKSVSLVRPPDGAELDLHLTLAGGYFGARLPEEVVWEMPSEPFDVAGCRLRALGPAPRLLHACYHAVLGEESAWRAWRDIAELLVRRPDCWPAVLDLASRAGGEAVVAEAVRATWSALDLDPHQPAVAWAVAHLPTGDELAALDAYRRAEAQGWAPEAWGTLEALGRLDRVGYLAGLAVPSRASLASRGRTRRQHLRGLRRR